MKNGTKPIKKDHRDYSFHRTFGGVTPLSLPAEFSVDAGFGFPDQVADGLFEACTAYAQLELCTVQDGIFYNDYETLYRQTLAFEDAPFGEGCDIRDSLKALLVYGPKTKKEGDSDGFVKRRGAFYAVESSKFSWFESIQSVMYTNFMVNRIKCAVTIGTPWFKEFDITSVSSNGLVPEIFTGDPKSLSWHNWAIVSWKVINGQTYLLGKTWQGSKVGDGGWYYYSKATINAVMKIKGTGAFTVAPYDPNNTRTVRLGIIEFIFSFFRQLFKAKQLVPESIPTTFIPTTFPTEPPVVPQPPKYLWDTKENIRHSMRVIGDEYNMAVIEKDLLCDVCACESGFNLKAKLVNSPTSIDRGLFQINGKYHPEATDALAYDPEWSTRWACKAILNGQAKNLWQASQFCWNATGKYNSLLT